MAASPIWTALSDAVTRTKITVTRWNAEVRDNLTYVKGVLSGLDLQDIDVHANRDVRKLKPDGSPYGTMLTDGDAPARNIVQLVGEGTNRDHDANDPKDFTARPFYSAYFGTQRAIRLRCFFWIHLWPGDPGYIGDEERGTIQLVHKGTINGGGANDVVWQFQLGKNSADWSNRELQRESGNLALQNGHLYCVRIFGSQGAQGGDENFISANVGAAWLEGV